MYLSSLQNQNQKKTQASVSSLACYYWNGFGRSWWLEIKLHTNDNSHSHTGLSQKSFTVLGKYLTLRYLLMVHSFTNIFLAINQNSKLHSSCTAAQFECSNG